MLRICQEYIYLMAKWLSLRQPGVNEKVVSVMMDEPNAIKSIRIINLLFMILSNPHSLLHSSLAGSRKSTNLSDHSLHFLFTVLPVTL